MVFDFYHKLEYLLKTLSKKSNCLVLLLVQYWKNIINIKHKVFSLKNKIYQLSVDFYSVSLNFQTISIFNNVMAINLFQ